MNKSDHSSNGESFNSESFNGECPNCGSGALKIFYQLAAVPTNSCILLPTKQEALSYPKGDIALAHCSECGFISNVAFNPALAEYSGRYEETQGFSATFNHFHRQLADRLITKHALQNKRIIEIGCGKGEFLVLLCALGGNSGVGFDPGFSDARIDREATGQITFIKDFYSEKYTAIQGDFLCCKMTLEHIHKTAEFIQMIRRSIGDHLDTTVFFQIPNALKIIEECAFEDIYYEHCSYFTAASLTRLFTSCQFDVLDISTEYDHQYLALEAKPTREGQGRNLSKQMDEATIACQLNAWLKTFPERLALKLNGWRAALDTQVMDAKKMVLWGSGSKAVSFLTTLGITDEIDRVVDINPFKRGYSMAGTGHPIIAPEDLLACPPDTVIVMNPIYRNEVADTLAGMNLYPELLTL